MSAETETIPPAQRLMLMLDKRTRWLGHPSYFFPEIDSTNRWLSEQRGKISHGTVVFTDFQSAGKGRHGRGWVTPHSTAIAVSIYLQPNWPAHQANWLTMMAGIATIEAIDSVQSTQPYLKWPNDIIFVTPDGVRKAGGILLEGQFTGDSLTEAIIGIGLNVNLTAEDLAQLPADMPTPATSLYVQGGNTAVNRLSLLALLLERLEYGYARALDGYPPYATWKDYLHTLGQEVLVTPQVGGSEVIRGTAVDVNSSGELLVKDEQGQIHPIAAGDVTLRPPQS
jgi:BirA family transcriptional regulator, biotin operon repressor / biotin---[acetyl-CoA-carboxylase] ligase